MGMRLVAKRIPAVARAQPFGGTALCTAPGDLTPLPGLGSFARLRILPLDERRCPRLDQFRQGSERSCGVFLHRNWPPWVSSFIIGPLAHWLVWTSIVTTSRRSQRPAESGLDGRISSDLTRHDRIRR